jgi:hypothetical protein
MRIGLIIVRGLLGGIAMLKDWKEITDDELLNFDGSQTAIIARYERIMAKKTIDALMEVRMGMHDVKKSMHTVTDKLEARLLETEKIQKEVASSQGKLQRATIALTAVIALSTVFYTWITWQSVKAQREANQIQREARNTETKTTVQQPSNPALQGTRP